MKRFCFLLISLFVFLTMISCVRKENVKDEPVTVQESSPVVSVSPTPSPEPVKTSTPCRRRPLPKPAENGENFETPANVYIELTPDAAQITPGSTPEDPGNRKLNIDPKIPGAIR